MGRVKHIETRVVTLLGVEDDDGNLVRQFVLQPDPADPDDPLVIRHLSPAAFAVAAAAVRRGRDQLEARVAADAAPPAGE